MTGGTRGGRPRRVAALGLSAGTALSLLLSACAAGSSVAQTVPSDLTVPPPATFAPVTVTLLAHDSFAVSKQVLADFTARTGITVKVVTGGDAGQVVNKAVLTAGNPEGDVLFGVDNTLLSRAVDAGVFAPYRPSALASVAPALRAQVMDDAVVPVDYGDVCVVADDTWFARRQIPVPQSIADLTDPRYRNLLVVENPATSSPGLAFLLATVARYGTGGWQGYWSALRANGVKVDDDWTTAYDGDFTAGGQNGGRPLVLSYGTDPVASIVYAANPKPTTPTVSVVQDGCWRQVEFAGVLAGTPHVQAARAVVDLLLSQPVQRDVPLSMFVFPSVTGTPLPAVFAQWAVQAAHPLTLPSAEITAHRTAWVDEWNTVVLR
jgi:thiamine transport system substrate-binding protein